MCGGWPHEAECATTGSGAFQDFPLCVLLLALIRPCFGMVWILPLGVLGLGPPGRDSVADRSMSDAACDLPWATCEELQSDPQLVTASAGPRYTWEGPSHILRLLPPVQILGQVSKRPKTLRDPPSPASCLLCSATEGASDCTQVVWGRFWVSRQGQAVVTGW